MTIQAQLADGRLLEFPDGTDPQVIQNTVKRLIAGASSEIPGQRAAAPAAPAQPELTTGQKIYQAVRPYVAPTVEALGAVGGGLVGGGAGTVLGPVGTATGAVGGAGIGYGMAKELLELGDVYLGGKPRRQGAAQFVEPVQNIVEGSTFEAGGRVLGPVLAKGVGKVMDLRNISTNKASDIVRNALGPDLPQVLNALKASQGTGQSAAQATAQINSPTFQALVQRATERDPRFLRALEQSQGEVSLNALARLAGGTTATETRAASKVAKETLKDITSPARQAALTRANQGQRVAALEAEAGEQAAGAASKVQQVRNLESGKNKAIDAYYKYGVDDATGQIVPTQQAAHMGNLAKDAERWAANAADASLDLGQGAQFAQAAADSLRSAGIKPLEGDSLVRSIRALTNNPKFAGNDILAGAVNTVADDIAKWTSQGGVIDARALDAIRKNSVNAAIQQLRPGVDATTQRNLAAGVMTKIKPMLIDAIEASGGKGYRAYLAEYTEGMQDIAKQKLTGEAQRLWKTDKDAFVRLVQGESPDVVEKFLGPGNYNIATELAEDTLQVLQAQAQKRLTELSIKGQVTAGQEALKQLLLQHTSKLRLPSYLSAVAATTNKAISILENKIGTKTMGTLTEALKTPEGAANLLERLPAEERSRVLKIISDAGNLKGQAGTVARAARTAAATTLGSNALAPTRETENALAE
jgi:hypothetical protein